MESTNMVNPIAHADISHERWAWEWCGQDAIVTHDHSRPPNVCVIHAETGTHGEVAARARLIATAPELMEALVIAKKHIGPYRDGDGAAKYHTCNIIDAAIRSAKGLV